MSSIAVVVAGAVSAVVMMLIALAFGAASNSIYLSQPELWKPMGVLWFEGMLLLYLLSGLVYALVYSILGKNLKGGSLDKGMLYGSLLWFVGPLPGVLLTHMTMTVDTALIVLWLLQGLLNVLASGIIVAFVFDMVAWRKENGSKNLRSGRKRAR